MTETIELKQELTKNIKENYSTFKFKRWYYLYGITDDGKVIGLNDIKSDVESLSGMIREGIIGNLTSYIDIEKNVKNKKIDIMRIGDVDYMSLTDFNKIF